MESVELFKICRFLNQFSILLLGVSYSFIECGVLFCDLFFVLNTIFIVKLGYRKKDLNMKAMCTIWTW